MNTLLINNTAIRKINGNKFDDFNHDYVVDGSSGAKMASGNNSVLPDNLNAIYREYVGRIEKDNQYGNDKKNSLRTANDCLRREIENLSEINLNIKSDRIPFIEKQIIQLKEEIDDIKGNPQDYLGEKNDKTSFYIGVVILFFLTCYLIVFYSSASYSGFFRVFEPGINLREAMLDPNAFNKAFNDGPGELLFILLMPFVFLALGYLIHKFFDKKSIANYLKVTLLLSVTFLFDGFLAYKISESIYSVNVFISSEEYSVRMALKEVDFWVVIFAGFVVYIVWGLVFDFIMKALHSADRIGMLIIIRNERIDELENSKYEEIKLIELNNRMIDKNKIEITKNDDFIVNPIISVEELKRIHYKYLVGWKNFKIENNHTDVSLIEADRIAEHCLSNYINNSVKTY